MQDLYMLCFDTSVHHQWNKLKVETKINTNSVMKDNGRQQY